MRKALALGTAAVVLSALLGGCAASRNSLGTHQSACFRVLPEALAAVHDHGHFSGEQYLAPRELILDVHNRNVPKSLSSAAKVATCLVAFTGHFQVSLVKRGWAPQGPSGKYAIVVVRQRDLVLLATVVLRRIPRRLIFGHVFPRLV
jgi:hypothetical protein